MKVPVKEKQVGPRRRVVTLRIERACFYELKTRAESLGCSLEDLLDVYVRTLAFGDFRCSDPRDERLAECVRLFRVLHPDEYRDIVDKLYSERCGVALSEEVQEDG